MLWLAPLAVCLALFRLGLFTWFMQDDFAGLLIATRTHTWGQALEWLTRPQAQGVLRPLPDCFYYIGLYHLYGFNALPYRLVAFATQFGSLLLLNAVVRRLTGSPMAGLLAALVWTLNAGLIVGMAWSSAYSQILCAFFYLLGFWLFLRHVETGRWRYYAAQWLALIAGIGTLEIILVYPVVVALYCYLNARKHLWKALAMLVVTGGYGVASMMLVSRASTGPYAFHLDASIAAGLWHYWTGALGTRQLGTLLGWSPNAAIAVGLVLTAALAWAIHAAPKAWQRTSLLGLAWFIATMAPVLPLRDQRMDYYLTVPSIGFALCVAAALAGVWTRSRETPDTSPRRIAIAWLLLYAGCSIAVIDIGMRYWYERGESVQRLMEGALMARREFPDQTIVLSGVNDALFYAGVYDRGFAAMGLSRVFLAPGSAISPRLGLRAPSTFELSATAVEAALRSHRVQVFDVSSRDSAGRALRNITSGYKAPAGTEGFQWVDAGEPFMGAALGSGWWDAEGGSRWMRRRAEVHLAAPKPGQRLHLRALYPGAGKAEPVRLTILANGVHLGVIDINQQSVDHLLPLPQGLIRSTRLDLVFEADHTFFIPPDQRDLSVAFGLIELAY